MKKKTKRDNRYTQYCCQTKKKKKKGITSDIGLASTLLKKKELL